MINIGWNFDNSYAGLNKIFFTKQEPTPVKSTKLLIANKPLGESLGLVPEAIENEEVVNIFAGNKVPEGAIPIAQAYAGHQFGHFTMLGDGRALLLGEQITPQGERFDIQLKGSGRTPYSRGGDGRAATGPMLREYIMSEAMYALGIPTTRSLAVVETGEQVMRDELLPGAILTRIAASHIRVGTFQYAAAWGSVEDLRELAEYTLNRHFSQGDCVNGADGFLYLLKEVIRRQAELIAKWQLVGFIHGVMNTDNMAISGETIDYGPCAFMDAYDPSTVFSSIDTRGRYAFGNQPPIAEWNLVRFAETLLPLLHDDQDKAVEIATKALEDFTGLYKQNWLKGMRKKLGLFNEEEQDKVLINELVDLMHKNHGDFTNTFVALTFDKPEETGMKDTQAFISWFKKWQDRLGRQGQTRSDVHQLMRNNNPAIIPRNHRVEEALEAAVMNSDLSPMHRLLGVLANPYAHSPEQADFAAPPAPSSCKYKTFCGT
jgi:uncharacterized protein YdiU (UPF0061 family)